MLLFIHLANFEALEFNRCAQNELNDFMCVKYQSYYSHRANFKLRRQSDFACMHFADVQISADTFRVLLFFHLS